MDIRADLVLQEAAPDGGNRGAQAASFAAGESVRPWGAGGSRQHKAGARPAQLAYGGAARRVLRRVRGSPD